MHYIAGKEHTQTNKAYLYNTPTSKKVHIRGQFKIYLVDNKIEFLSIAYRETEPHLIYFIPCFENEYDKNNKPAKVYLETKKNHDASFSCSKLFNELNIPICDSVHKDEEQKFKGHQVPYTIIVIDKDRLALCLNLRDVPGYTEDDGKKPIPIENIVTKAFNKIFDEFHINLNQNLDQFHNEIIESIKEQVNK